MHSFFQQKWLYILGVVLCYIFFLAPLFLFVEYGIAAQLSQKGTHEHITMMRGIMNNICDTGCMPSASSLWIITLFIAVFFVALFILSLCVQKWNNWYIPTRH